MQERVVVLDMTYNVDLGEKDESVEYPKRPVVQHSGEDDIAEVLNAEKLMYLCAYRWVFDFDDLAKLCDVSEELTI